MKKFFLVIPLLFVFVCFWYANAEGPGTWTTSLSNTPIFNKCVAINPVNQSIIYAASGSSTGAGDGLHLSVDGGSSWITLPAAPTTGIQNIRMAASNPNVLYVGTYSNGMYKTTDGGSTFTQINTGLNPETARLQIQAIGIKPNDPNTVVCTIWDGTSQAANGVFKTTNGGTTWVVSNNGTGIYKNFLSLGYTSSQPNVLYMGSSVPDYITPVNGPERVFKSTDFGSTWVNSSNGMIDSVSFYCPIRDISVSDADPNVILASLFWNSTLYGGPWVSTNGGALWVQKVNGFNITGTNSPLRSALVRPGSSTEMFVGGGGANPGGVWRSTDGGNLWLNFAGSTMDSAGTIRSLAYSTSTATLFAGADVVTIGTPGLFVNTIYIGVKKPGNEVPKQFSLHQNYPNPFNPSTTITFDLPKNENVTINVYDVSGKMVASVFNENVKAGSYDVNFDASKLSSGVYFYKIVAGSFVDTKKMMLVK